jgi:hypothetical protein
MSSTAMVVIAIVGMIGGGIGGVVAQWLTEAACNAQERCDAILHDLRTSRQLSRLADNHANVKERAA